VALTRNRNRPAKHGPRAKSTAGIPLSMPEKTSIMGWSCRLESKFPQEEWVWKIHPKKMGPPMQLPETSNNAFPIVGFSLILNREEIYLAISIQFPRWIVFFPYRFLKDYGYALIGTGSLPNLSDHRCRPNSIILDKNRHEKVHFLFLIFFNILLGLEPVPDKKGR